VRGIRASHLGTIVAALIGTLAADTLAAQGARTASDSVPSLIASHAAQVASESGNTLTFAVHVTNRTSDSVAVQPRVTPPADWVALLGIIPFTLPAHASDSWLLSLRIPTRARAGRYTVAFSARDGAGRILLRDSIEVELQVKHGVTVTLTEHPSYAVSSTPYRVAVVVQNRGNVDATYALSGVSSLGGTVSIARSISLAPDETRTVRMDVASAIVGQQSLDDIAMVRAVDMADTTMTARASSQVTIVQRANASDPKHTVAATLRLRAAGPSTGVSPVELVAAGALRDGGSERVDVVLRSRVSNGYSLGDQEEYRVGLQGTNYRVQLGDAVFNSSPLTSAGQRGAGAGVDVGDSTFGASAYAQAFRFQPGLGREQGGALRVGAPNVIGSPLFGVSVVSRNGGLDAGDLLSTSARLHPADGMSLDFELAGSRSVAGTGSARTVRFSGGTLVHVSLGHLAADPTFAGYARGGTSDFASVSTAPWNKLQFSASGNRYRRALSDILAGPEELQQSSLLEMRYDGHYSLGYVDQTRSASFIVRSGLVTNRGVVARADGAFGLVRAYGSAELGRSHDGTIGTIGTGYNQLSAGFSAPIGPHTISVYGQSSQGAALLRGADRVLSFGADLQAQLAAHTTFTLSGSQSRTIVPDGGYSLLDARVAQTLSNGATLGLRMRVGGVDFTDVTSRQRQAYLEYSVPLRLPTGPARSAGRVHGQVVEQGSGRGLPGALVRLGPQSAITDDEGRVAFAGLPAGAYRLTLAQQPASGTTVFNGDPNVRVEANNHAAVDFHVAVEAGGTIDGTVRRLLIARTGLETEADSLGDGGPLEGVTVSLSGVRDTLYRSSDAVGNFQFTDVPSGSWTLRILGDTPTQAEWTPDHVTVTIGSGERRTIGFRLSPKRRRVKIQSGDGVIEG
jgi:hypothetical protein